MPLKQYLGDQVYIMDRGDMIALTTENGLEVTNEVFIEDDVLHEFIEFLQRSRNVKITIEKVPNG